MHLNLDHVRLRRLAVLAIALLGLLVVTNAAARNPANDPPVLLSNSVGFHGGPVFGVRPHIVFLASAMGGELKLHWHSWTRKRAFATGTSYPDHGHYAVRVTAFRPRHTMAVLALYFTRLDIRISGHTEHLGLFSGTFTSWETLDFGGTAGCGCAPFPS